MNFNFLNLFLFYLFALAFSINQSQTTYFTSTRYYDPKLSQLIQPDSKTPGEFQDPRGLNRHTYVFNNPLRYNDPDGHTPQDPRDENKTLELLDHTSRIAHQYLNSNQNWYDKYFYIASNYRIFKDHKKHMDRKIHTGIIVMEGVHFPKGLGHSNKTSGVFNAGPMVAADLQRIAGDQATIEAEEREIGGEKAWEISYSQNSENFNSGSHSSKVWPGLKRSLDAGRSLAKKSNGNVFISVLTTGSEKGLHLSKSKINSQTTILGDSPNNLHIQAMAKTLDDGPSLAITLAHELRFTRYLINDINHGNLLLPTTFYTFYNSPSDVFYNDHNRDSQNTLYQNAYNENKSNPADQPKKRSDTRILPPKQIQKLSEK